MYNNRDDRRRGQWTPILMILAIWRRTGNRKGKQPEGAANDNQIAEREFKMISAHNVTLRLGKKALFEEVNIKLPKATATG